MCGLPSPSRPMELNSPTSPLESTTSILQSSAKAGSRSSLLSELLEGTGTAKTDVRKKITKRKGRTLSQSPQRACPLDSSSLLQRFIVFWGISWFPLLDRESRPKGACLPLSALSLIHRGMTGLACAFKTGDRGLQERFSSPPRFPSGGCAA